MKIIVKITTVYGNERIYPVCDSAKLFASIAGTTSLTREVLSKIKQLGYSVEVESQKL